MDSIDKERLDVLAGARGGQSGKGGSAVRRRDLAALLKLPPVTATEGFESVSVTEYNALRSDFLALRKAIDEIAARMK